MTFFNGLRRLIVYIGIGAICHALFEGSTFDINSAWTVAWLFAWPVALIAHFFNTVMWIVAAGIFAVMSMWLWEKIR